MAIYTLDDQSIAGVPDLDNAHRIIAELSRELVEMVQEGAPYDAVRGKFQELATELKNHFAIEEKLLDKLHDKEDVARHLVQHVKNHNLFRDTIIYAESKFDEKKESQEIPNVIELFPQKYFDELKGLDAEMADLLAAYGVSEKTP